MASSSCSRPSASRSRRRGVEARRHHVSNQRLPRVAMRGNDTHQHVTLGKDSDGLTAFHHENGAHVVIVGRSNIVGKPIANMMVQKGPGANSTVTVVHTRTKDLEGHCKRADILIVAAGVPGLVKPEWIKPGACVIDVGVNRVGEKISEKTGKKIAILKGDVDFDEAKEIAGSITPVPGGVGPMTVTMLMVNTLKSLKFKLGIA